MTKTLPISEAREHLRALVEQASRTMGRVIITRNGKPEAVLMGYDEYESWVETLDTLADPEEMEAIREGAADIRVGNVVSFEEAFGKPNEPSKYKLSDFLGEITDENVHKVVDFKPTGKELL